MNVAVLSNIFRQQRFHEVEDDLVEVGRSVVKSLQRYDYDVTFFDVNERSFEKLRKTNIDIAFNVCERFNGNSMFEPHVAAMLELLNIPYTGSGPLTLATCMNKIRVKEILMHHGIPTPKYQIFYSKNKKLNKELRFPLIVKPGSMDNSIGIMHDSIVHNEKEMRSKINFINRTYNQPALVEEYIEGRDIDAGILGNGNTAYAMPLIEVVPEHLKDRSEWIYSYEAKWDKGSEVYDNTLYYFIDGDLPKYVEHRIKRVALQTYRLLNCKDYGRMDIRLSKDNVPYVLEMNPNPGISADCSIPFAAESMGLTYDQMIYKILMHAMKRYGLSDKPLEVLS